jgi:hypothetical protein
MFTYDTDNYGVRYGDTWYVSPGSGAVDAPGNTLHIHIKDTGAKVVITNEHYAADWLHPDEVRCSMTEEMFVQHLLRGIVR